MYTPKTIEPKWQKIWDEQKTFQTFTPDLGENIQKKYYILDMFPYPSGSGLHVGHPKGYTATDVFSRYKKAQGYNVLHTMGWDAFGLPAENYAVKTGRHPRLTTQENIDIFRGQIKRLGLAYDWEREINTTDENYYRWTQWIFSKIVSAGLAYEAELPVNWCPNLKCVLANEEIVDGVSEVGGHPVEKRKMRQWVLKITDYAEELLKDIDTVDWPEGIKEQQRNWIGKSEGCEFEFKLDSSLKSAEQPSISVYTTRIDTAFGIGWVIIAPDHPRVQDFITPENRDICNSYIQGSLGKSDQDRLNEGKEKTGVPTGSFVINPFNGQSIPVWIGDYVLGNYGTGAVMGVAAHDERDFAFAKKYQLPITSVISGGEDQSLPYTADGILVNSSEFNGLNSSEARTKMMQKAESEGFGKKKINYKLRDWIFSRQRYWGEPMPIIHIDTSVIENLPRIERGNLFGNTDDEILGISCTKFQDSNEIEKFQKGKGVIIEGIVQGKPEKYLAKILSVEETTIHYDILSKVFPGFADSCILDRNLPVRLPEVENYLPTEDGRSPLAKAENWLEVQITEDIIGVRETNTMPQWAGSCWYYIRYMDPKNTEAFVDPEIFSYWNSVDLYVGGAEHAVLHLLYARFWHKILFNLGILSTKEPFQKLINQGLILAPEGGKMSKSKGNVINPDAVITETGADALRAYILSMSDFRDPAPWDTKAIIGISRFLERAYGLFTENPRYSKDDIKSMKLLHKTIKKVGEDIENFKFNTAISALMILSNEGLPKDEEFQKEWKEVFTLLLHPFVPHLAEELWEILGKQEKLFGYQWPQYDEYMTIDDEVVITLQVNGKVRGTLSCLRGTAQEEIEGRAQEIPEISKWIEGKKISRIIFVPNKLLNFVVIE